MGRTRRSFYVPTSREVVLLIEIALAPCHFGGGGSLSV